MPKRTIRNFVCRTGESIYSGAAKAGLKGHSHIRCAARCCGVLAKACKKVKVAHTRLPSAEVPELIPVLGSQPAGDVSIYYCHCLFKCFFLSFLLSTSFWWIKLYIYKRAGRPAVTPTALKRAATRFAAWWTEARWVWTVCLRLLPDSVATAIWTQALLRLSTLTTRLPNHTRGGLTQNRKKLSFIYNLISPSYMVAQHK